MYLLYVDESGTVGDSSQQYFILAGVSVFERQTHWVEKTLNEIAASFTQGDPYAVELHGSPMRMGRGFWRNFPKEQRIAAIQDVLARGIVAQKHHGVHLFAAVIKKASLSGRDPIEYAFEQLASRFDLFLKRLYHTGNTQRGLMVFDKSKTEERIQTLAHDFKYNGHKWGTTVNYAEVPVFLDSKASRLIQLADLAA